MRGRSDMMFALVACYPGILSPHACGVLVGLGGPPEYWGSPGQLVSILPGGCSWAYIPNDPEAAFGLNISLIDDGWRASDI